MGLTKQLQSAVTGWYLAQAMFVLRYLKLDSGKLHDNMRSAIYEDNEPKQTLRLHEWIPTMKSSASVGIMKPEPLMTRYVPPSIFAVDNLRHTRQKLR